MYKLVALGFYSMLFFLGYASQAQYKNYDLTVDGDTINAIDQHDLKQGDWVESVGELRGNPGYDEEGKYKNGQKEGYWRRYSSQGDLLAVEHYKLGGKDGEQLYYTFLGKLEREENWRAYNPDAPYDTIAIYGSGSNEIVDMKVVKAEPYSVKDGEWKYYDSETGSLVRTVMWDRNRLLTPQEDRSGVNKYEKSKTIKKTPEMIEWERKNSGKKGGFRDGATGM